MQVESVKRFSRAFTTENLFRHTILHEEDFTSIHFHNDVSSRSCGLSESKGLAERGSEGNADPMVTNAIR